jgi:hypothetical protein
LSDRCPENKEGGTVLTRRGSTYTGTVEPFRTGFKSPEPVATGRDGALFVGDWTTGKIYRITVS